jgi:hypothetical protein
MSFIQGAFAPKPLHTREQVMATMIAVADELGMPDKRGACIIAGMTVSQEAGADGQFWCPGNHADPCFDADPDRFPHDSLGNDSRSVGLYQQQTSGPNDPNPWGWGGLYGDPEGTRKRMDLHDSTVLFMGSLKRSPYAARNALEANKWAQTVQRSGVPDAYAKHWGPVNELYDRVAKGQPDVPVKPEGFNGDPVWLADVLGAALGDRLVVEPGWEQCGTGGTMGDIFGVMIHHTANSRETVEVIRDGRPDLAGPLSQCLIKPSGKCHLIAVGPCNHAGIGDYPGVGRNRGNERLIGFECAWPTIGPGGSYDPHERWPDAQIITMRDATAAVLKKLGYDQTHVIGHKDYATAPPNVKWDPGNLSMEWFRQEVGKDLRGEFDSEPPKPPAVPPIPLPIDYARQTWEQTRGRWAMLGDQTIVEALAEVRDKVTGSNDRAKVGVRFD